MAKIACFLLFYFLSFVNTQSDSLVVHINSGLIEGEYVHSEVINTSYYSFRGIPYAKPPVGKLRFLPPVEPEPWDHVLETKAHGSICVQIFGGSEDCLYLNVYTPNLPYNEESDNLLPVMVFIHGGGFIYGFSNSEWCGPDYLIDKNIVLVTFNYRLNIFGFLNAMEESAPGNVGLKDQLVALQWVQENIDKFNGNPKQVTIFGQSAGAAAVQYHMQSKLSKGLFQRAILQSGSTLDNWAFEEDPLDLIHKLGNVLNIDSTNITEFINKLQSIPARQLFEASESEQLLDNKHRTLRTRFIPSIECDSPNAFITEGSYSLLEGNNLDVVPSITGHVSNEGLVVLGSQNVNVEDYKKNPLLLVPKSLNILSDIQSQEFVATEIDKQYFNNDSVPFNLSFAAFQSDEMFVRGIRKSIELQRNKSMIYHYIFDYKSQDDGLPGVPHSGELQYILYIQSVTENEEQKLIREQMTTLWTNFAKTGNPTPNNDPILVNIKWPTVSKPQGDLQYLYIGKQLDIRKNPWQKYYEFWEYIFRSYGRPPFYIY